jgi:hypothetical protein
MTRFRSCGAYPPGTVCSIPGCGKPVYARGWCSMHHSRWHRNGTTDLIKRQTVFKECSPIELAFAAGIMEGEGSVRINALTKRNKGHLAVSVTNTNKEILNWMNDRWPGYFMSASVREECKPAWVWAIAANKALSFLDAIAPYVLTERMKERIDTARWWQKIKSVPWQKRTEADAEEAFACWHWMSHLNRRGRKKS